MNAEQGILNVEWVDPLEIQHFLLNLHHSKPIGQSHAIRGAAQLPAAGVFVEGFADTAVLEVLYQVKTQ